MNVIEATYAELKQAELNRSPFSCLDSADIDINPHQIEAFTFALSSIKLGGAILADEVGLGKTIEAGLVMSYLLRTGYKRILLVMPSNLRKQWQIELEDKFSIDSFIVDSSNWEEYLAYVKKQKAVVIASYNFASRRKEYFARVAWDFCVFDEAHRMRNMHKSGAKMSNNLFQLTKGIPKIMLTATPMQNSLLDLYGLAQFIDERIFYDKSVFSERYMRNQQYDDLKNRMRPVIQRTLRKEVADYIKFSERREMTVDFDLSVPEMELYAQIDKYLKKELLFALPNSHRTLITSVIRKLLASSSMAVAETFEVLKRRLQVLKETTREESVESSLDYFFSFFEEEDVEEEPEDFFQDELYTRERVNEFIQHEIDEVDSIIKKAESIKRNSKMTALKRAVKQAFDFQEEEGIFQKVVIFTESVRTQQYIYDELSKEGYDGDILTFNGSSGDKTTKEIFNAWRARNYGKCLGSRSVEIKNAIVQAFKESYKILIVTDSGSEGLNLQFCNTIINYDLPWNPQKIEQRIGRCHRYGQQNDVVVFNLLNTQNYADQRVYEILSQKFELFKGVFGASDKAIGLLESGADFEKRVSQIYQACKTSSDFTQEFKSLEKELDRKRNKKMEAIKSIIIKEAPEEHKADFEKILNEIDKYKKSKEQWGNISTEHEDIRYPLYYEFPLSLNIPGVNHGFLIIGGYYKNDDIDSSIFHIVSKDEKIYEISDDLIKNVLMNLNQNHIAKAVADNNSVNRALDKLTEYLEQEYRMKNSELIKSNDYKVDNWLELRKEEYILSIKDTSLIDELNVQYETEANFRKKIEIKKKIDEEKKRQMEKMEGFHEEIGKLEDEAYEMKSIFEREIMSLPQLFAKIVIKF